MRKKKNTCAGPKNNTEGVPDSVHPFSYGVSLVHAMEMRKACDEFFRKRGMPYGNQYLAFGAKTEDKEVEHV